MIPKRKYKFLRVLRWIVINGAFSWAGFAGLWQHQLLARNAFLFAFWLNVILSTLLVIAVSTDEKLKAKISEKGLAVPQWISTAFDAVWVIGFAALGHFWMAGFWCWQVICERGVFEKETK